MSGPYAVPAVLVTRATPLGLVPTIATTTASGVSSARTARARYGRTPGPATPADGHGPGSTAQRFASPLNAHPQWFCPHSTALAAHVFVQSVPGNISPAFAAVRHRSGWQVRSGTQSVSTLHSSSENTTALTAPEGRGAALEALATATSPPASLALDAVPVLGGAGFPPVQARAAIGPIASEIQMQIQRIVRGR